jgi:hypothetical protein
MARGINVGEDLVVVSVRMVSTRLLHFKLPSNRRT